MPATAHLVVLYPDNPRDETACAALARNVMAELTPICTEPPCLVGSRLSVVVLVAMGELDAISRAIDEARTPQTAYLVLQAGTAFETAGLGRAQAVLTRLLRQTTRL
jgi:hypothetical protein